MIEVYDPMLAGRVLPLRVRLYPLGFPLELTTDNKSVIAAAETSWRRSPQLFRGPVFRLRVTVEEFEAPLPPEPLFRSWGRLLSVVSDRENVAVCDMVRGEGFCRITPATVADAPFFRYHFLEAIVYTMLQERTVISVHAACVSRDGRGVLLFGPPAAGKSCMAYACATRGWTLVSDDATAVVRGRMDAMVVGNPNHIRFRRSASALFPELARLPLSASRNGKAGLELDTAGLKIAAAAQTHAAALVFLKRHGGERAELQPVDPAEALRRIEAELPFLDAGVRRQQRVTLRVLLSPGAWELHYGEPGAAVARLTELVERASNAASNQQS